MQLDTHPAKLILHLVSHLKLKCFKFLCEDFNKNSKHFDINV